MRKNRYFKFLLGFIVFSFSFLEGSDIIERRFGFSIDSNIILSILVIVLILGLIYTRYEELENKKDIKLKKIDSLLKTKGNYALYLNIILSGIIVVLFFFYYQKDNFEKDFLKNRLPAIHNAYEDGNIDFVYKETKDIIERSLNNSIVQSYYDKVTTSVSIFTSPINIKLYFQFPGDTTNTWNYLGETPLENIRIPQKWIKLKFVQDQKVFFTSTHPYYLNDNDNLFIFPNNQFQEIENFKLFLGRNIRLRFPGIDHLPNVKIGPFQISKTEVTNSEYQEFVNDGGYNNPKFWDFPIVIDGIEYTFDNTIHKFVGEFQKPGPSNWSYSKFPKGQDQFPVTGISWFEARAYAKYMKMDLPNVYQWSHAANLGRSSSFVPNSNFSKNQLQNVGNVDTDNYNELYEIAGNVREWIINISNESKTNRAILGGCYLDDDYFFNDYYGQNAFERSIGNGLRLAINLDCEENLDNKFNDPIFIQTRDYYSMPRITEEVFNIYKNQFQDYNTDLTDKKIEILDNRFYKVERYELPSIDGNNVFPGYIFYNSKIQPPYKPIIFFPGSNAIHLTNTDIMINNNLEYFDYLLEEGYAVVHPIYISTYEREDDLKSDYPEKSKKYKNHVIAWGKEFKKTIDYIEKRKDLDINSLSFYGVSWGGYMANTLLAIDNRVKAAVLNVAGYCFQETYEEIESYLYTPRIKCPVIMLNGKYDVFFPLETSQKPMFDLLGTRKEDKKHYVYPSGHYVPRKKLITEHLLWLSRYLDTNE